MNDTIRERLEYLRGEIRGERISMGELVELQGLAEHIDPSDVELLEWAGVPEFTDEGAGVTYEPWTNGFAVGFKCSREGQPDEYIYLNPSTDDTNGVPNVFVYQGTHGDPALDGAEHYYPVFGIPAPDLTDDMDADAIAAHNAAMANDPQYRDAVHHERN